MATINIDWDLGNIYENQEITLNDSNNDVIFDPPQESVARLILRVVQGPGLGAKLASWPAEVLWTAGSPPVLSLTADAVDVIEFVAFDTGGGIFEYYGKLYASNIL